MIDEIFLQRYLEALLAGDRRRCREVIEDILHHNSASITGVYSDVIWPIMVEIDMLYRAERITSAQEHLASRINRTIVDQLQNKLPRQPRTERKVVICSSLREISELGSQIIADMFESAGWDVRFLGGGLSNDDILSYVHQFCPEVLVIYGTEPAETPQIRSIIDRIKEVNAYPDMRIMLSGGIFSRAEGLWEEIGADLFAPNAIEAVQLASDENQTLCRPVRTINQRKRKQLAAVAEDREDEE
ncbi:MAG: B12-binding domain-containing protein [Sedimentisphaerales bacterium]|nr:B12-binding domain-containing protein [Sedimentisphaerales bacterium]